MLAQVWWATGIFRHLVITYAKCIDVHYMTAYLTRNFFLERGGRQASRLFIISSVIGTKGIMSFWISRSSLLESVHFLYIISVVFTSSLLSFFIIMLVFLFAYIMSNIDLVLKGQKFLFQSFLVRLRENLLVNKYHFDNIPFTPRSYFELKLIVLNHI